MREPLHTEDLKLVERTGAQGLALLRLQGKVLPYLNLAARPFVGGPVQCPAYPEVPVSGVSPESINGRALAAQDEGWKVSLAKHPRLAGAPASPTPWAPP